MKVAIVLAAVALAVAVVTALPQSPKVASSLLKKLESGERAVVLVTLTHGRSTKEMLKEQGFKRRSYPNRAARINAVVSFLKAEVEEQQRELVTFLQREKSEGTIVRPLWVTNKIVLRNVDLSLVQKLSKRADVATVAEETFIPLHPLGEARILEDDEVNADEVQWGVQKILAEDVWASGNRGEGVVVSNIDTGVRGGHEALVGNHRADYGWYDPADHSASHSDLGGHGTHTMGSICGGGPRGIGVAPGAQWVACKGCGLSQCSDVDLLECGQWISCPTDTKGENADCSKAPNLVSSSWGGGQGEPFYDDPIAVWRELNIIPLFSIGNSGPSCGTANSPGDSPDVIGVGSTNSADGVSIFSSLGPTVDGRRKPEIAGPGTDIVSASNLANNRYATMSGTSMSCPHAAGLVALILSQFGELEYEEVLDLLIHGAVPHKPTGIQSCGGLSNSKWPNNHVGYGRINAVNTVLVNRTLTHF